MLKQSKFLIRTPEILYAIFKSIYIYTRWLHLRRQPIGDCIHIQESYPPACT